MAFNPNDHMMKLKGKDYLQVAWRLVWFREDHPDYGINAQALELTEDHAIFKATITDANGIQISSGHGSESKRDFGDFIEKAETKAVGRALAMLGYGTQFAADELDEGERIVDSPIDRRPKQEPVPADGVKPGEKVDLPAAGSFDARKAISAYCYRVGITAKDFGAYWKALVAGGIVPQIKTDDLTPDDFEAICKAMEANYGDALKVTA